MYNIKFFDKNNKQKYNMNNVSYADTFQKRLFGLMGKSKFDGLIFKQNIENRYFGSIHTCFMKTGIDIIYINTNMEIQEIVTLTPWKLYIPKKDKIKYIIELPKNTSNKYNLKVQDTVVINDEKKKKG